MDVTIISIIFNSISFFCELFQLYDRISTKSVVGASGRHPPPDAWARARDVLECIGLLQDASSRSQAHTPTSSLSRGGSLPHHFHSGGHHHMPISRDLVVLQEILTSPHFTVSKFSGTVQSWRDAATEDSFICQFVSDVCSQRIKLLKNQLVTEK